MRRRWRTARPWITPAVVLVEAVLVATGVVGLGDAALVVVAVEVLLAVTVAGSVVAAARRFRGGRAEGRDGWTAAADALAEVLPRAVGRMLLIEARIWTCLLTAPIGRARRAGGYPYARGLGPVLWLVLGLAAVEGAVVEVVLAAVLGNSAWVWVALGLHLYALVWIGGVLASLSVLGHRVGPDRLLLRDSVFTELAIPYAAVAGARAARRGSSGRTGLAVDGPVAVLAYGDATVRLTLRRPDPDAVVDPRMAGVETLWITVDDAQGFVHAVRARVDHGCGDQVDAPAAGGPATIGP